MIKKITIIMTILFTLLSYSQTKPKIALVLSGGGAKGIAHIGVISELEKKGIKPDVIIGTSMGALIGGLYAMGYSPEEMAIIVQDIDWNYILTDEIKRENRLIGQIDKDKTYLFTLPLNGLKPVLSSGLYSGQNILTLLDILTKDHSGNINFDSLPIPFRCIGTNIETGEMKIFDKGRLSDALRASMSIPSIFRPYCIDNELYVDGSLVNNYPTDIAKQMGADLIIGVNVGATLYKKRELNSIIKILDQSSSFYNYKIAQKNKKLSDVNIRPDIEEMSAMNFNNIDSIIMLGTKAAIRSMPKIDSVFSKYNLSIANNKKKMLKHRIYIDSISINPLLENNRYQNSAKKLVMGKLNIKTPTSITTDELQARVNRLFGSKFFQDIKLNFKKDNDICYAIHIQAKEKQTNDFNIGIRYDITYGINVLVGVNFRNLLIYGSLLEANLIAGQSPEFKFRYSTDHGRKIGAGTSITYNLFDVYTYKQDGLITSEYSYHYGVWDIFAHTYIANAARFVTGVQTSFFLLKNNKGIEDLKEIKSPYYSGFAAYILDTRDHSYFPNKGVFIKIRNDLIFEPNASEFLNTFWGRSKIIFPTSKKLKFILDAFFGLGSSNIDTTLFRYQMGGMAKNRIQWYNSFQGLRYLEKGAANVWIVKFSPRYEFYKNNFLTATFALTAMDKDFNNLFIDAGNMYAGMSLTYGFYSMFGPMELSADYSFYNGYYSGFVSLGFWF